MRLVFMGTPDFAVPTLIELVGQGHDIAAVYTRAPAPGGRGMALRPSPVHHLAQSLGLRVETPKTLRTDDAASLLRGFEAEAAVVVAYGLILPEPILAAPTHGCLNLHGSLLPRWRGAAPMQRAIMAGDTETGVMVMQMDKGLDTGPVAMAERLPITPDMTAGELHDRLAPLGADLMARAVSAMARGSLQFRPQPGEGVTYASKIEKSECRIDWSRDGTAVHDRIRGLSPSPGAFFEADLGRGIERIKVLGAHFVEDRGSAGTVLAIRSGALTVACGQGGVALTRLQRAGKPAIEAAEFLRGTPIAVGTTLVQP